MEFVEFFFVKRKSCKKSVNIKINEDPVIVVKHCKYTPNKRWRFIWRVVVRFLNVLFFIGELNK